MTKSTQSRREAINSAGRVDEKLDPTPVEVPLHKVTKSIAQQIQEQIAIQIAKKQVGDNPQTPDQIYAELCDLDDPGPEHMYSQYEYEQMEDTLMEGIDYPTQAEAVTEDAAQPPESVPPETTAPPA